MHIQSATFTFDSPEKANEAITGIWERGGYVRPTPGRAHSVDVVADTDAFMAIRQYAMPTAGAPESTHPTQPITPIGAEGSEGNPPVPPQPVE